MILSGLGRGQCLIWFDGVLATLCPCILKTVTADSGCLYLDAAWEDE